MGSFVILAISVLITVAVIIILRLLGAWMLRINDVIAGLGKIEKSNNEHTQELWNIKVLLNEQLNKSTGQEMSSVTRIKEIMARQKKE